MDSADRDRKKAWKQGERDSARSAFPLPSNLLEAMFNEIEERTGNEGCDHSQRFTKQWLSDNQQPADDVLAWLKLHGGFCDCEVLANPYDHWMQNK